MLIKLSKGLHKEFFHLAIFIFLVLFGISLCNAQDATFIYKKYKNSIVSLSMKDNKGEVVGKGSAVYMLDNVFITNAHVVESGSQATISVDGKEFNVKSVEMSKGMDVAFVLVDASSSEINLPSVQLSDDIEVGQTIFVISNPVGLNQSITNGIVSSIRQDAIQHTASVSPGSSGGAIFTSDGNMVGLVTARHSEETSIGFGLSVSAIMNELKENEGEFFSLFDQAPLLNEGTVIALSAGEEKSAKSVTLVDFSKISDRGDYLNYNYSMRVLVGEGKDLKFAETKSNLLVDCKNKIWQIIDGALYGTDPAVPLLEIPRTNEWSPVPSNSKIIIDALCNPTSNKRELYFKFRELHSFIIPNIPELLFRRNELISDNGELTAIGRYISKSQQ